MSAPMPMPLSLCLAAQTLTGHLSSVRRQVAEWATEAGLYPPEVDDVVLATHEALANVADHAYPHGLGEAWLDVERHRDAVVVMVRDQGSWQPPAADPGWRGRGLVIMRGLADHLEVHHRDGGTTVRMQWQLPEAPLPAPDVSR